MIDLLLFCLLGTGLGLPGRPFSGLEVFVFNDPKLGVYGFGSREWMAPRPVALGESDIQ